MNSWNLLNECDYLIGNVNRMMVCDDISELKNMYTYAVLRLTRIYYERFDILSNLSLSDSEKEG